MGYAIARAAIRAGHKVTLISAPTALRPPSKARLIEVETSADMFESVKKHFSKCDCLVMAAAVSDYTPIRRAKAKVKKGDSPLDIKLKPTADILKWAGTHKNKNQVVVGFALEDRALRAGAQKKLCDKKLDMIVANSPDAIGAATSTVHIKTPDGPWTVLKNKSKQTISSRIIALSSSLVSARG
jgi:phosphopantothenoylcysteine decarboxylase/phosphopantothenate--cysteine ligase